MGQVPAFDPNDPKSPLLKATAAAARLRPVTWFLVNVGNKIDPTLMKISGGRLKTTLNAPTVLVTHTGAKSGKVRTTPLAYFTDGEDVVIIASNGGSKQHPAWYRNVSANPEVELWSGGQGGPYRVKEAKGRQRKRLWQQATTLPRLRRLPAAGRGPVDPRDRLHTNQALALQAAEAPWRVLKGTRRRGLALRKRLQIQQLLPAHQQVHPWQGLAHGHRTDLPAGVADHDLHKQAGLLAADRDDRVGHAYFPDKKAIPPRHQRDL